MNGPDVRQSGFPNVQISGYDGMGVPGWMPLFRTEESFTTSHNVTWSKGAHELRFGFDGVLNRMNHWQPELGAGPRGYLEFDGGVTALNGGPAVDLVILDLMMPREDGLSTFQLLRRKRPQLPMLLCTYAPMHL